jgi:hypothetical protein
VTPADREGWSFAAARVPAEFAAAVYPPTPELEHALGNTVTLCGIAEEHVVVYRHLFAPETASACPICRQQAASAPLKPCVQERLHELVLAADAGPMRESLLDALRQGAEITFWINGPAASLARYYVQLDQIGEGSAAVVAALSTNEPVGLAKVEHRHGQFIVVLPEQEPPQIAHATSDQ